MELIQMGITNNLINNLASLVPGQSPFDKCRKEVVKEKETRLRLWKLEDLKELCNQKGLDISTRSIVHSATDSEIIDTDLGFYELIKVISEKVSVMELVDFAKQKQINTVELENNTNKIKKFYNFL